MGVFARLFGAVPREERDGIRLTDAEPWRLGPTRDVQRFLRALPQLFPDGAVAYFEGTAERHVTEYLRGLSIQPSVRVAVGTLWPKPDVYHVPLTPESMESVADFLQRNPAGYFCSHCHVYRDGVVLLQSHDAFISDPIYISRAIPRDAVDGFARALGSSYSTGW